MNREIKFRGKMIPENEWIFGTILRIPAPPVCFGKSETDKYYIQFPDPRYMPDWNMSYKMVQGEVNPNTIGQYAGIDDKNGKEIYEGDMVSFNLKTDAKGCPNIIGYIEYQTTFSSFRIMSILGSFALDYNIKEIEVIGNIYDNPELLKEDK